MALVSEKSVHSAAKSIIDRGGRVSWTAVRDQLGGGSPNDVLLHLRTWRAARAAQLAVPAPSIDLPDLKSDTIASPALPEVAVAVVALEHAVAAAVLRVQGNVQRLAEARLLALAGSHSEGLAARDRLHAAAVATLELRLAEAEADADAAGPAIAEVEVLRGRVADLDSKVASLSAEVTAAAGDLSSMKAAFAEAIEGRAVAVAAAEHAEAESREWKAQLVLSQGEVASVRLESARLVKEAATSTETLRGELTELMAGARRDAAEVAKLASEALDAVRGELAGAVSAARLAEQRLADAHAAEVRERTARERAEDRAGALVERASRAEAELAMASRPSPAPLAAA